MKSTWIIPFLALLMSCATTRKVETAKTLEIYGPGVIQAPVIADLDVKEEKVSGTAVGSSASLSTVKNLALVDAIKKARADVLVSPLLRARNKRPFHNRDSNRFPGQLPELQERYTSRLPFGEGGIHAPGEYRRGG
ncbi:MAG: hypothetical protein IPO05_17195 [Flavobacteriales bacterium]|nr:hypothetical protein [Flavobacteriales bacterium]